MDSISWHFFYQIDMLFWTRCHICRSIWLDFVLGLDCMAKAKAKE